VSDSGETDWDLLGEFARHREELDPVLLRGFVAGALRRRGYSSLVLDESIPWTDTEKNHLPGLMAFAFLWSTGVSAAIAAGAPWYLGWLGILGVLALVGLAGKAFGDAAAVGVVVLAIWLAVAAIEVIGAEWLLLAIAFGLPLTVVVIYATTKRLLPMRDAQDVALALGGAIKSAPLVIPLVLIVLFLPALSADVWQLGERLSAESLLIVGLLSVGILLVVVRLQLGGQIERMLHQRAAVLSDAADRAEMTRDQAMLAVPEDGAALLGEMDDPGIEDAWPAAGEEYAPYLNAVGGSVLQKPLTGYLAITVVAIGVLLSLYVYLLCSAVVPRDLAAEWSGVHVPQTQLAVAGVSITLKGGPFIKLAALLGIAATATYLSFALVEERFATALTDSLLRDPTDRFLVLALPYINLRERILQSTMVAGANQSDGTESE
jgi:hypothetical protein